MNDSKKSPAIAISNLDVTIDKATILKNITLSIPTGSITGLLGPSGSGKTTMMRTIVGLQKISKGEIKVLHRPAGSPPLRRQVGYMTQSPSVYDDLTVAENIGYFGSLISSSKQRGQEVMDQVEISPLHHRLVGSLSGGERARVSLAVAMLGEPALLVLDEPTVGLDPLLRNQLWTMFRKIAENGVTLLVSSHVMDEANRCDNLLLLRNGKLLASSSPQALKSDTKTGSVEEAFIELVGSAK